MTSLFKGIEKVVGNPITLSLLFLWVIVVSVEYKYIDTNPLVTYAEKYNGTLIESVLKKILEYEVYLPSFLACGIVAYLKPSTTVLTSLAVVEAFAYAHSNVLRFHILVGIIIFGYFALNKDSHRLFWFIGSLLVLYNF